MGGGHLPRARQIFAVCGSGSDGRWSLSCKAPPGAQEVLVASAPERYFVPAYVGHRGWIGVRLDDVTGIAVDWDAVADLLEESYRMTAPKRLAAQVEKQRSG